MGTVIHNMDVNNYDDDLNDGKTDTHDSDVDNDDDVARITTENQDILKATDPLLTAHPSV